MKILHFIKKISAFTLKNRHLKTGKVCFKIFINFLTFRFFEMVNELKQITYSENEIFFRYEICDSGFDNRELGFLKCPSFEMPL